MSDHEFGNISTDLKLSLVEEYLHGFTQALKGQFGELWYIDAFAGTGERTVRYEGLEGGLLPPIEERIERRRGSARIALDTVPAFDRIIFMEQKKRYCRALAKLAARHPERQVWPAAGFSDTELS
ncbi:hypothetical protein CU102_28015 [Phyllobacterium brassicacearum]|uniref:Three-Cys-motif partner protein TcmP n=1 Tax=Phyllobacterium brassicacearum TaxID=314235 RepID=A0A2P7ATI3_9HYPH|nr:three-Cys-motif partner protein TcmP [Phyllobacterium brassicacearum]PSH57524.1 hypothetical protein CU102_28015 [Phyllobacterium brassicacearum]TDQ07187.1 three-Cys-motif partner protein [Phyllobacterium brassicacearum]